MFSHKTDSSVSAASLAHFGDTYGYRFSFDTVELNASFELRKSPARPHAWALQLRASAVEGDGAELLVAEASLPPLEELGGAREAFHVSAPARIPAGTGEFRLALVLVSKQEGQPDLVHDRAAFPQAERFCGPRFSGPISHERTGHQIRLALGAIANSRSADNQSGTLAVELWALPVPYTGGDFHGVPVSGAALGQLSGQASWNNLSLDLAFTPPPAGLWHLTLMLREWTGSGYTTRDFHAFERPLLVEPNNPPAKPAEAARPAAPHAPVAPAAPSASVLSVPPMPAPAPVQPTAAKAQVPPPKPLATGKISVNKASAAELAKVKGLTKATAAAIVAARPFESLDQLSKIKGIGSSTLAKLRSSLTL